MLLFFKYTFDSCWFSTVPFSNAEPPPINNWAHLEFDSVIYDTLNWVPLQGSFVPDSAYQYILIGNFFDDQNTTIVQVGLFYTYAYYYIDDVCVVHVGDSCSSNPEGINNLKSNGTLKLFPNPAKDKLTLEDISGQEKIINLRNAFGKLVYQKKDFQGTRTLEIDIRKFPEGIYFILVEEGEKTFSQSIIIQQ